MPIFMNPFQKHDVSDFPNVFVPLAHATRNASVVADHNEKLGIHSDSPVNDKEDEANVGREFSANTVEGLRAEIDLGTLGNWPQMQTSGNLILQILRLLAMIQPMIVRGHPY